METKGITMARTISSLQHPIIKHLVHLRQNSDYRYEHQSAVVEGSKMTAEIGASHEVKALFVCDEEQVPAGIKAKEIYIVDEAVMKKASGMQSPEGVLAEVALPHFSSLDKARFIVALDHVNDPGNLGAILRTALAFGWEGAFLIGEGCDPYNEKAIRSARGATFRIPLRMGGWKEFDAWAEKKQTTVLAADLEGEPLNSLQKPSTCVLVLGNEAHGPSDEVLKRCKKVTIPMAGPMESLNVAVAGGILMYSLRHGA